MTLFTERASYELPGYHPATGARHPTTSFQAAQQARETARTQRERVYEYIRGCGEYGATDEEIQDALAMGDSHRARRIELERSRRIWLTGRTRPTKRGGNARVWIAS